MNQYFKKIKKNFGFGMMRLPMLENGEVDYEETKKMTDQFVKDGFTYFDTAHGYLDGKSEIAFRECVAKRYARDQYILTDKLTGTYFKSEADIRPLFESQLEACGVDYFDFYLMHAQTADIYEHYKQCHAYEMAQEFKKEGKVKHVGISFHDKADVLDRILNDHPEVEAVQIQFNYVDYEDPGVESRKVLEVARKHGKPVIVMEPVKGGSLVKLPEEARAVYENLGNASFASYAIRFAAGADGIMMVLSGMSNYDQMEDNLSYMKDFKPLSETEMNAVDQVRVIFRGMNLIPCTACHYCTSGCPKKISIPDIFADLNAKKMYQDWNSNFYYEVHTHNAGKASDCIKCGKCEKVCPQHLSIRDLLAQAAETFEQKENA